MRLHNERPAPGDTVVLTAIPPALLDGLPLEDQQAISEAVGKPVGLNAYDDDGRAELRFADRQGTIHFVYVNPRFIRSVGGAKQ
jgi:hypothetical protein